MILELKLPFPPSLNHFKKIGGIVKTKTGKLYQQRINTNETKSFYFYVYRQAKLVMPPGWAEFSANAFFFVKVYLYPPDNRKRDIDNSLKVLFDSLVKAQIISDDSKIHRLYVEKCHTIEQGQVIVRIQEL